MTCHCLFFQGANAEHMVVGVRPIPCRMCSGVLPNAVADVVCGTGSLHGRGSGDGLSSLVLRCVLCCYALLVARSGLGYLPGFSS